MKNNCKLNIVVKVTSLLVIALIAIFAVASVKAIGVDGYKAILDYDTLAEAQEAAKELNIKLSGEGSVLLKNDGTLPVEEGTKVVVFGAAATSMQGGTGRVDTALAEDGFDVYPTVFNETNVKNGIDTRQFDLFHELAVVVLKRGGGEGSDLSTVTNELAVRENAYPMPDVGDVADLPKDAIMEYNGEFYQLANDVKSDALTQAEIDEALSKATYLYPDSFEHYSLGMKNGRYYKHYQQLTNDEYRMIEFAKANFNKVVVLLNTSNAMEVKTLDEDEKINGILWFGRPGQNGVSAVGDILKGKVNPSGKLADEWFKDFTLDPTWYNFGSNAQNAAGSNTYLKSDNSAAHASGLHGIDYEEGIYLGYWYAESVYAEIAAGNLTKDPATGVALEGADAEAKADAWYEDTIMYPFGYGLSYSDFDYEILEMYYDYNGKQVMNGTLSHDLVESSVGHTQKVKVLNVKVKVTNKGQAAGKEVVQIYVNAPYTGDVEKPAVKLVGFEKTSLLKPGKSEVVTVQVNFQDMASYDYLGGTGSKGYVLEAGIYSILALDGSHGYTYDSFDVETFTLDAKAYQQLDDYSDNVIRNLFSKENGSNYSLRMNDADWNEDGEVNASDKIFDEEMTQLSRANFAGTFPKSPVTGGKIGVVNVTDVEEYDKTQAYAVDALIKVTVKGTSGLSSSTPDVITYYRVTTALEANATTEVFNSSVTKVTPDLAGELIVTDWFADFIAYWDTYNLDTFVSTPAFSDTARYAVGDNVLYGEPAKIYEFVKAHGPQVDISAANSYKVGDIGTFEGFYYTCTTAWTKIAAHTRNQQYNIGDMCTNGGKYYRCIVAHKAGRNFAAANWEEVPAATINEQFMACFEKGEATPSSYPWNVDDVRLVDTSKYRVVEGGYYKYSDFYYEFNPATGLTERKTTLDASLIEGWTQMADAATQAAAKAEAGDAWISFYDLAGISYLDTTPIVGGKFNGKTGAQVWKEFMNQLTWEDMYTAGWSGGGNGSAVPNVDIPAGGAADSPTNWNSTYTWCCATTIGQTFNKELAREQGIIVANMGLLKFNGKDQWMAPAMNTHRTPFSGRNNEYYSQDGIHMGLMGEQICLGAQSRGVVCHVKHMFLNDQETNRNGQDLFAWVSEQAMREIYAKSFQIVMQEGGATGTMTAFARIGAVPCPDSYNFQTELVRHEWGLEHFMFHTDFYSAQSGCCPVDLMVRAGDNHAPITSNLSNGKAKENSANPSISGIWDPTANEGQGGVVVGKRTALELPGYVSNIQWYLLRLRFMQMYSEYSCSAHVRNGIVLSNWKGHATGESFEATQGTAFNESVKFDVSAQQKYTIQSGALPAGLTLNESTGAITGTPLESGSFTVSIRGTFDKWIYQNNTYRFTVASAFTLDKNEATTTEAFDGAFTGLEGAKYALAEDSTLPEGLALSQAGAFSGTAKKHGTYTFTVNATVGSGNNAKVYPISVTLTVTGEDAPALAQYKIDNGYLMALDPETGEYVNVVPIADITGPQGEQGPKGDKGDTGETGAQGPAGPAGADGAQGPQGEQGPKGDTGADGAQGPKGDKGDTGATGAQGPKGDTGATGAQGPAGPAGADGAQGPKGDTGETGPAGADGAKGDKGDKGDTGAQGPQGEKGEKGDKGDKGDPGEVVTPEGCGSVIGISAVMISGLAICGAALALRRKERE